MNFWKGPYMNGDIKSAIFAFPLLLQLIGSSLDGVLTMLCLLLLYFSTFCSVLMQVILQGKLFQGNHEMSFADTGQGSRRVRRALCLLASLLLMATTKKSFNNSCGRGLPNGALQISVTISDEAQ